MPAFIKVTANYRNSKEREEAILNVDTIVRVEEVKDLEGSLLGSILIVKDEFRKNKVYPFPVSESIDELAEKLCK